jgi:hypothetical protein
LLLQIKETPFSRDFQPNVFKRIMTIAYNCKWWKMMFFYSAQLIFSAGLQCKKHCAPFILRVWRHVKKFSSLVKTMVENEVLSKRKHPKE